MPYYPERRPDLVPAQQKPRPAQQRKKLLCLFLAVLACALVVWGAVGLIRYFSDLSASRQTAAELRSIYDQPVPVTEAPAADLTAVPVPPAAVPATEVPVPAETPVPADYGLLPAVPYPYNSSLRISDRFTDLRRKGKYITGWLRMDSVDEPVVLKDNSYFLTRDATGKKNVNGAIFMDAGTRLETRPYTVILYGHNMKSGSMFGRLRKYRDGAYLSKNRFITFDTLYEDGRYAVFAAAEINVVPGTSGYFDIWSLDDHTRAGREAAIRKLESRAISGNAVDVQPEDQILLLVTCVEDDDYRLVVAARRLRDSETESTLTYRK